MSIQLFLAIALMAILIASALAIPLHKANQRRQCRREMDARLKEMGLI